MAYNDTTASTTAKKVGNALKDDAKATADDLKGAGRWAEDKAHNAKEDIKEAL